MEEEKDPYTDWHTHEVLHTVYIIQGMVEDHVCATRTSDEFLDIKKKANKIAKDLADLYQLIGTKYTI